MRNDKKYALKLRREGKSYNEIKSNLNIPKSTLSDWLRDHKWSQKISARLNNGDRATRTIRLRALNAIRGNHLARVYREARVEAKKEFAEFQWHPLFIAGIAIYWGEGDKKSRQNVRVSNIDPALLRVFISFLIDVCGVPRHKVRASLLLYPDLEEKTCKSFWIKKTALPESNFVKSIVIHGKHKTNRVQYGICTICVSSVYLKEKIKVWLILLSRRLVQKEYLRD